MELEEGQEKGHASATLLLAVRKEIMNDMISQEHWHKRLHNYILLVGMDGFNRSKSAAH